jgi:hypothetical protein
MKEELEQAAEEFAKKRLVFTDEFVGYDKGMYAAFIAGANYANQQKQGDLDFGDYSLIEQKRYGVENEMYKHKVIGKLSSNSWVDVPVQTPAKEVLHDEIDVVVACICCGVNETEVLRYRLCDIKPLAQPPVIETKQG